MTVPSPLPIVSGAGEAPHVLVVEDDEAIRVLIVRLLRENGCQVTGARNSQEMWQVLGELDPDLIVLDVMLPGTSGLDICRVLRARSGVPILMVSARGDEVDRVIGLELGADDYVPKPFGRAEFLARVRALLRRSTSGPVAGGPRGRTIKFAGWELDLQRRELVDPEGASVDLSGAEHDLLLAFLDHPGRVLSRGQLLEMARSRISGSSDRSVDVLVSRLRRKLEPVSTSQPLIKTVRGMGYILAAKVERS